jgi:y4mF family transcriptional regulator
MLLRRSHDLAELLRSGRARAGWSQSELAERVGVSRQWISSVETGKTSVEFDLVVGALQVLGYRMYVESSDHPKPSEPERTHDVEAPTHAPSPRTPLTRQGEPLGKQRTMRRRKRAGHPEGRRD